MSSESHVDLDLDLSFFMGSKLRRYRTEMSIIISTVVVGLTGYSLDEENTPADIIITRYREVH